MNRRPIVAGQFYPSQAEALIAEVRSFLDVDNVTPSTGLHTLLAMCPHAGYVYSGAVTGQTLSRANLAQTLLLIGPNHSSRGAPLALWNTDSWLVPSGSLSVNSALAATLATAEPRLVPDYKAHLDEHSLEVILPFLIALSPKHTIVPIAVAEPQLDVLLAVSRTLASTLRRWPEPVSMVVSSDMSHYISHNEAIARDQQALKHIKALNPTALYETVRDKSITMCGVLPMTLGLAICKGLGAKQVEVAAYATSAVVNGNYASVVAYAGVLVST